MDKLVALFFLLITVLAVVAMMTIKFLLHPPLSEFDPDLILKRASQDLAFDNEVTELFASLKQPLKNTLVHLYKPDCICNSHIENYLDGLTDLAKTQEIKNLYVNIEKIDRLTFLANVPAVAFFNHTGQLAYLGPYYEGSQCSFGDGFIESVIVKAQSNNALIITDVEGCFCQS